jgi:hypothetical protein
MASPRLPGHAPGRQPGGTPCRAGRALCKVETLRLLVLGLIVAAIGLAARPRVAAAQCEGGGSVAGYYRQNGAYVSGSGCGYTGASSAGQLYPSGARPGLVSGAAPLGVQPGPASAIAPLASAPLSGAEGIDPARAAAAGFDARPGIIVGPPYGPGVSGMQSMAGEAYSYSLTAAPPATAAGIRLAGEPAPPPAPGRGGATYIGQEVDTPLVADENHP